MITDGRRVQHLLWGYAAFAVCTAWLLWLRPNRGLFLTIDVVFLAVAGLLSAGAGVLLSRGGWIRTATIAFESVLVPLQFALSIPSSWLLVGMALSGWILFLLRPTFPRLSAARRKLFLTLHVGFSVGWLGATMAMTVLSVTGLLADDAGLKHHAYAFMHIFDLSIVTPLVMLSLVSGLVMSFGTHWGLIRHWWVVTKLLLALGIVGFAGAQENFWVRDLAARTGTAAPADTWPVDFYLAACMVCFSIALWTATALSIYKPWGRTRWGRNALARQR